MWLIAWCGWEGRECNRLDGLVLANAKDGMWVCVRGGKKREAKMRRRMKEGERDLFKREDGGHIFLFQERDDRWKERLRWDKGEKKGGKKSETKEADIKRNEKVGRVRMGRISGRDPINLQPGVNHMGGLPVWASFSAKRPSLSSSNLTIIAPFLNGIVSL